MRRGTMAVIGMLAFAGVLAWTSQLMHVERKGSVPVLLRITPAQERKAATFDASLPMIPVGVQRVVPGDGVLIVHYWAPWERHSGPQAVALDSLRRSLPPGELQVAVVCFDPYPSVSRYVARMRLRLPVLLDLQHALSDHLPCPSIPYTYVIDPSGRIAAAQGGEVDWLSPATRSALDSLASEPVTPPGSLPMPSPS